MNFKNCFHELVLLGFVLMFAVAGSTLTSVSVMALLVVVPAFSFLIYDCCTRLLCVVVRLRCQHQIRQRQPSAVTVVAVLAAVRGSLYLSHYRRPTSPFFIVESLLCPFGPPSFVGAAITPHPGCPYATVAVLVFWDGYGRRSV